MTSGPTEAELLAQAQNGDRVAFGLLVRQHQSRVFACAMRIVGRPSEAEDVTQEAFVRAWRALPRFDGRSELSTWLYRITVNVALNHLSKRKRRAAADIDDPRIPEPEADPTQRSANPEQALLMNQLHARMQGALDQLSESLRTTVVLVLMQGVSHQDAAKILGCPEGTVAWRIHEARRRLRTMLRDVFDEPSTRPVAQAAGGKSS